MNAYRIRIDQIGGYWIFPRVLATSQHVAVSRAMQRCLEFQQGDRTTITVERTETRVERKPISRG